MLKNLCWYLIFIINTFLNYNYVNKFIRIFIILVNNVILKLINGVLKYILNGLLSFKFYFYLNSF